MKILKAIFSSKSGLSSKRIMGVLSILFAMGITGIGMVIFPYGEIHDSILYASVQFLVAGSALLGITVAEKGVPKFKATKKKETFEDEVE